MSPGRQVLGSSCFVHTGADEERRERLRSSAEAWRALGHRMAGALQACTEDDVSSTKDDDFFAASILLQPISASTSEGSLSQEELSDDDFSDAQDDCSWDALETMESVEAWRSVGQRLASIFKEIDCEEDEAPSPATYHIGRIGFPVADTENSSAD